MAVQMPTLSCTRRIRRCSTPSSCWPLKSSSNGGTKQPEWRMRVVGTCCRTTCCYRSVTSCPERDPVCWPAVTPYLL
ncbi:hypothetical protein DPMN_126691 [Dreissena polymorpha]|uniref:Uncharacterized protein n=1 Tax=Dreissena polymorpha TaxID=45954 RepID=A0A9D4JYD9_DREPO|nr:hypothetical protein DPMN_126691 [Dreissena polymorpha]